MRVSRKAAGIGLNLSIAVFVGFSVYGFLEHIDGGASPARPISLSLTILYVACIAASIAGIGFFGHQQDLRKTEERRAGEEANAREASR
jgi:hypothetical protein